MLMMVLPPSPSAGTLPGHGLGKGGERCVHYPEARDAAGPAGGWQDGVDDAGERGADVYEPGVACGVGDARVHEESERAIDGGLGEGDRRVYAGLHLGRGAGEVGGYAVAFDGHGDLQDQRAIGHVVGVDVPCGSVHAVREGLYLLAGEMLRVVYEGVHVPADGGDAVSGR